MNFFLSADIDFVETEDSIEVNGVVFQKPFVEKPINADDHNVYIYFPVSAGGGSQRLFRKVSLLDIHSFKSFKFGYPNDLYWINLFCFEFYLKFSFVLCTLFSVILMVNLVFVKAVKCIYCLLYRLQIKAVFILQ